jgi:hypothetical protein
MDQSVPGGQMYPSDEPLMRKPRILATGNTVYQES